MVHAEPGDLSFVQQPQRNTVRFLEDDRILGADGRERVDVEEAAVVDLFRRDAPVGEPIDLRREEPIEEVEAARLARLAVEDRDVLLEVLADARVRRAEGRDAPLDDFLLAAPLVTLLRILLVTRGQVRDRGDDALQLVERRVALGQLFVQLTEPVRKDLAV